MMFFAFVGCNNSSPIESPDNSEPVEITYYKADLDYFNSRRYTATITENQNYIFWADNEGLHKYNKKTKETYLLLSTVNIDFLLIHCDKLYYVENEEKLCRIDFDAKLVETIFELDKNYMSQIQDYTVSDGKVFFLNTHTLFYYDISSKSINELKSTTVEALQVVGDDIYFTDHGERTNTIYIYSMRDHSCRALLGDGKCTPAEKAYIDFRIVNDTVYYTQAIPSGTYAMPLDGESKIIRDGRVVFACDSSVSKGVYYMSYSTDESHLYFHDNNGNEFVACFSMMELNLSTGVSVVDGYAYYNSGVERVLDDTGHYIYNYDKAKPTAKQINENIVKAENDPLS